MVKLNIHNLPEGYYYGVTQVQDAIWNAMKAKFGDDYTDVLGINENSIDYALRNLNNFSAEGEAEKDDDGNKRTQSNYDIIITDAKLQNIVEILDEEIKLNQNNSYKPFGDEFAQLTYCRLLIDNISLVKREKDNNHDLDSIEPIPRKKIGKYLSRNDVFFLADAQLKERGVSINDQIRKAEEEKTYHLFENLGRGFTPEQYQSILKGKTFDLPEREGIELKEEDLLSPEQVAKKLGLDKWDKQETDFKNKTTLLIEELLTDQPGFCIGEHHLQREPLRFIIDNMEALKANGVTTLGLEIFKADREGSIIKEFNDSNGNDLPKKLEDRVTFLDLKYAAAGHPELKGKTVEGDWLWQEYQYWKNHQQDKSNPRIILMDELLAHESKQSYNYRHLLASAKQQGISILPIDSTHNEGRDVSDRVHKMDRYAIEKIENRENDGKFITLTGMLHVKGISEGLNVKKLGVVSYPENQINQDGVITFAGQNMMFDQLVSMKPQELNFVTSNKGQTSPDAKKDTGFTNGQIAALAGGGALVAGGIASAVSDSKRKKQDEEAKPRRSGISFKTVSLCILGAALTTWAIWARYGKNQSPSADKLRS